MVLLSIPMSVESSKAHTRVHTVIERDRIEAPCTHAHIPARKQEFGQKINLQITSSLDTILRYFTSSITFLV